MSKIALFSDIHANLPALEAFFTDVETRNPDFIYCLGDLVGYNIWPNEVVDAIRKRNIPTIAGNYDFGIGRESNECGCAYKTEQDKADGAVSISFTNELIGPLQRQYLRALPAHMKVEYQLNSDKLNLLLVHGSPRKINEYLFEDRDERSMLRIMQDADADILCFGHTHKPYHRILDSGKEGKPHYRHAINIGSVGKPKDGDNRGGYVLLTIDENSSVHAKHSVQVEFIRFAYDYEKAARAIEESILPDAYAQNLRQGC
ncbi:metallophosphoesterase family protein [Pontibacter arcticus]|uniref:YfcE family phosphodiesterase n=1 Tax=Pontibacter arcticus TaxID=2080288 RepID=A0A364REW8_9BACT|nr:metallophosphoesterase family protein [Pontibacter arcticus]RAU82851.1 YfcE family phosphodiesterase [Pontibacter arcticus]